MAEVLAPRRAVGVRVPGREEMAWPHARRPESKRDPSRGDRERWPRSAKGDPIAVDASGRYNERRSHCEHAAWPSPNRRRGPKPLADILGELFAARGFGRLRALKELEDAWNAAVGEPGCRQTRLGEVRRGVLNVTVAHPTLLEELAAFQKPTLLAALRRDAPGT